MLVGEKCIRIVAVIISVMTLLLRFFIYDRKTHSDFVEIIQRLCIIIEMSVTIVISYIIIHYLIFGTML